MDKTQQEPVSPVGWDLINDLSFLPENEDLIVDFLLKRLQKGEIYTWVGALLLAVNPRDEKASHDIYNYAQYQKYINSFDVISSDVAPHIFAITARAYYRLIQGLGKSSQMIVISGESGTGKTFNAQKALDFLVVLDNNGDGGDATNSQRGDQAGNVVRRITSVCPLVCAFTTASTANNESSSRHGQIVKLQCNAGKIRGASIHSFLLERSRVTKGTSNFHIFYQMMNGLQPDELAALGLSRDEKYRILGPGNAVREEQHGEDFRSTLKAMDVLGFSRERRREIFEIIALIVHMGDIEFVERNECCAIDLTSESSAKALRNVCTITRLSEDDIEELLTTTLIVAQSTWRRHTAYRRNLISVNACQNRLYSIIRHLYDRLFHWLVDRVNEILSIEEQCTKWLGILDIFGFESIEINGMEQLCVNYTNERLQQYFIDAYVEAGKKHLREEGLISEKEESSAVLHSYQDRLDLLEGALFVTLNDASQSLIVPDIPTIMKQAHEKSCKFKGRLLKETCGGFLVNHYAGPIEYSVRDLLSNNTDKIPSELAITFGISRAKFLRLLSNTDEEEGPQRDENFTRKGTTLAKLKFNLDTLIRELNNCDSHYVRCVRPRRLGAETDNRWERKEFRRELMCTGIFDALPLARCKYPIRLSYEEFYKRYSKKPTGTCFFRTECRRILSSFLGETERNASVYYGNRFIFLMEAVFLELEISRRKFRSSCVDRIQRFWLKYRREKKVVSIMPPSIERSSKNIARSRGHATSLGTSISLLEDEVFEENTSPLSCSTKKSTSPNTIPYCQTLIDQHRPADIQSQCSSLEYMCENACTSCENINNPTEATSTSALMERESDLKGKIDINCNENNRLDANKPLHKNNDRRNYHNESFMNILKLSGQPFKNFYVIPYGFHTLFFKNRVLSRQRLAEVPIKFHIRRTCLLNSQCLPRSELPNGLQDCL